MSLINRINFGVKEFKIWGLKEPTQAELAPQVFFMTLFSKNELKARSKFLKQLNLKQKIRPTKARIAKIEIIEESLENMEVKNYSMQFVYRSRKGLHNMNKEFRAVSRCDAVRELQQDMAGRYKVKADDIFIISLKEVSNEELTKQRVIEFVEEDLQFPIFKKKLIVSKEFVPKGTKYFN